MSVHSIVLLPGDGIGREVTAAARSVLEAAAKRFGHDFSFTEAAIGGAAIDSAGDPLPPATLAACRGADAVFLGAIGGPKWDKAPRRPEQGLLELRGALGVYANLRPLRVDEATIAHSPLRAEIARGVDFLIVRELTGGLYFGERTRSDDSASDLCTYSVAEIERVARIAFAAARGRRGHVTSVDKANVLETSRLWRETVTRLHQAEFPDVALDHGLVDSTAMHIITRPRDFDVILTENLFGDILSDEASVLGGSIGLLGSASLGDGPPGLFEPIHGSAPDIAGTGAANPIGAIRSAAMLLDYGLRLHEEAAAVERAVTSVLKGSALTPDLGGAARGSEVAAAVTAYLAD